MVHMPGSVKAKAWKLVRLHIIEQSLQLQLVLKCYLLIKREQMLYLLIVAECIHAIWKWLMFLGVATKEEQKANQQRRYSYKSCDPLHIWSDDKIGNKTCS